MSDQESRPLRRGPEWFLEKIEAALPEELDDLADPLPPSGRLSRAEIDDLVDETLKRELAELEGSETPE
jgi:hypothetical protein